ncbi:MAG: class II fructose-bisphosphatase [Chloroflexota bacterium]|nr:class II fructose-bisphosphatase [Chloroflexota bacterium]MDE2901151.1 class II fructose-bisphosphatase [Chloroflexota bacterium]MDE2969056.1 class II fructose-bisphosphatase [Chloroflexota bacterium]
MATQRTRQPIERNLAMELARVTEAAAMAAVRHMGMGDKELVDQAAVDAMRYTLGYVSMDGVVVIGEGEKDEAPMLYNGEVIGNGMPPEVDIAVDPIDGTTLLSKGLPGAVAVVALSARGTMNVPGNVFYMNKIAVGPDARDAIDIEAGVTDNLRNVAEAKGCAVHDLTVIMLDRPRHNEMLAEVREAGARVKMISDGDIVAGIQAALPGTGVDMLLGIGGSPEAVLTAAAIRCIGGAIQCKPWPRDEAERERAIADGVDLEKLYNTDDLVGGEDVFFSATGASTGDLLKGVRFMGGGAQTQSLVMRSRSGTVRWIDSIHDFSRLDKIRFED